MGRDRLRLQLLHTHALDEPSVLTADARMREVRKSRRLEVTPESPACARDEGTSLHYLPAAERVDAHGDALVDTRAGQAASPFAFAQTRRAAVAVSTVSNSGDHTGEQFDTREHANRVAVREGTVAGAARFILTSAGRTARPRSTTADR